MTPVPTCVYTVAFARGVGGISNNNRANPNSIGAPIAFPYIQIDVKQLLESSHKKTSSRLRTGGLHEIPRALL